jgi:poly(A) polymerase
MTEPVVVPRAEHPISRRDIDADALKVLYRLNEAGHTAYLVGGSVRDLLLSRRPKDFDIGTSAHPYQIKKLFRNCWIIGRRFRLAHVRFGLKTIEVATFRKNIPAGTEAEPSEPLPDAGPEDPHKHDNTFGTPEEDAFRRDLTVNALFYDISNFSIIDYVGGLTDLREGLIRCIGDPTVRFHEDPVRMFRAIVMASRLGFKIDEPIVAALRAHRDLIATSSPARMIEEYYKVLRSGASEPTFRALVEHRLIEPITPEIQRGAKDPAIWESLAELDAYRKRFESAPAALTNSILLGTLLLPLGLMPRKAYQDTPEPPPPDPKNPKGHRRRPPKEPILKIGALPIARRDTERLRQLLSLQRRIADIESSPRTKRALMHRGPFEEALTWFEIHGRQPAVLEHWKGFIEALGPEALHPPPSEEGAPAEGAAADGTGRPRRRRRRRRGRGRGPFKGPPET